MTCITSITITTAWIQRMDPFAIQFTETFGIRWYGLAYAIGFVVAFLLGKWLAHNKLIRLTHQQTNDFIMISILGVIAGGRLGWVLFYNPSALWTFSSELPFWEVLAVNRGGMASHGGMIGVALCMLWFARRNRIPFFHLLDVSALLVPFGLMFGRFANFINGELLGRPCDANFFLAVKFPQEILDWDLTTLAKAAPAAEHIGRTERIWLNIIETANRGQPEGTSQILQLKHKLIIAVQDGVQPVIDVVEPLLIARHPSQLYQACAEGAILAICLWAMLLLIGTKLRHGTIAVWFLLIYGILRVITEVWRLPDAGIERTFGLSRGQWLSVGMCVIGLILAWFVRQQPHRSDATQIADSIDISTTTADQG